MSEILLIVNFKKNIDASFVSRIVEMIDKRGGRTNIFRKDAECFDGLKIKPSPSIIDSPDELKNIDLAIVLGGDGSIIKASSKVSSYGVPILGVNFGRVGYLAGLEVDELDKLNEILDGRFVPEERIMIETEIIKDGKTVYKKDNILNDIVLSNGPVAKLLNFDVALNGTLLKNYRADGIIIATPTGSTAYSMSAGGPILDPCLDTFCITPICSHSITDRPVIVPGNTEIMLHRIEAGDNSVYLSTDGAHAERVEEGSQILIRCSDTRAKLVRTEKSSFIALLNNKL